VYYHDIADWFDETPKREVMVAPRYLAGPVEPFHVIDRLAEHYAWTRDWDIDGGVYLASPCRRVHLTHRPQHGEDFPLRIAASERPLGDLLWQAEFQPDVPDEIIGAFVEGVARDVASRDPGFLSAATLPGVAYGPLLAAGWTPTVNDRVGLLGDGPRVITARDDLARLTHLGHLPDDTWITHDHRPHWDLRGGHPQWGPTWRATFAGAIPTHLIAAVTAEMADPRPVRRSACHIPAQNRTFARVMPAEWLTDPDTTRAARAHTTTTLPTRSPTATAPTAAHPTPVRPNAASARR